MGWTGIPNGSLVLEEDKPQTPSCRDGGLCAEHKVR
jgi:hypothetical protein